MTVYDMLDEEEPTWPNMPYRSAVLIPYVPPRENLWHRLRYTVGRLLVRAGSRVMP